MTTRALRRRLRAVELGMRLPAPTVEGFEEMLDEASPELLEHLLPRLMRKFDPDFDSVTCPLCGDVGLGKHSYTECASIPSTQPGEAKTRALLRKLECAIETAPAQLLMEALSAVARSASMDSLIDTG